MNRTALTCLALATLTSPAFAGAETLSRVVERTSLEAVAPCRGGRIVEQVWNHGNIYGAGSQLILVCLRDRNTADWVLIGGVSCHDQDEGKKCHSPAAWAMPSFSQEKSPTKTRYNMIKYGLGKRCHVFRQKFTVSSPQTPSAAFDDKKWICDEIDFYNGTLRAGQVISDPKQFRTIAVETTSRQSLALVEDEGLPADTFMIERSYYHYEVE